MLALADAYERFSLPPGALGELIEGVRMDVNGVTYERFEDLVLYCRRVAGAIGRVCLAIFGAHDDRSTVGPEAEALADDLGVAMQLTNILRDVREDAENGRVYLPAEDLRRFGLIAAATSARRAARRCGVARAAAGDPRRARRRTASAGALAGARALRGGSRAAVVSARHRACAAARQAQRRVRAGDGRHLPQAAQPHRGPPRAGAGRAHVAAGAREGVGGGSQHARRGGSG